MSVLWDVHDVSMIFLWDYHCICDGVLYGSMGFLWRFFAGPVLFACYFCERSRDFCWTPMGFPKEIYVTTEGCQLEGSLNQLNIK